MYGSRQVSMLFQDHVAHVLVELGGFTGVKVSPAMFYQEDWDVELLVHGDDFLADGTPPSLDKVHSLLGEHFLVQQLPRLGSGGEEQGAFVGRILRYHEGKDFGCQAGTKHLRRSRA